MSNDKKVDAALLCWASISDDERDPIYECGIGTHLDALLAERDSAPCDAGAICAGCQPRNADGSCPDERGTDTTPEWTPEHQAMVEREIEAARSVEQADVTDDLLSHLSQLAEAFAHKPSIELSQHTFARVIAALKESK